MFRYPLDEFRDAQRYYQNRYREGTVTELPDTAALRALLDAGFAGSAQDFSKKIEIIRMFRKKGVVFEYGCAWGYNAHQLQLAGFRAIGYEVSRALSEFGREELKIDIISESAALESLGIACVDIIVANHVLEHLWSLEGVFEFFRRIIREDGVLIIFVPNCGGRGAKEQGVRWGPMLGEKHTLSLARVFFERNLPDHGFEVRAVSSPYDVHAMKDLFDEPACSGGTEGDELMIVGRPR